MSDKRNQLIAKALTDPRFKAELLQNPAAAIETVTGVKVAAGVTVKIVEDSASVVHLVIPNGLPPEHGQLSDGELGKVAGGAASTKLLVPKCLDNSSYQSGTVCLG